MYLIKNKISVPPARAKKKMKIRNPSFGGVFIS